MQNKPKIVCLTMTTGNRENLGETIQSFKAQTYENRELVILDTHPQEMKFSELLPGNITYYRVPRNKFNTLEQKMKYALFLATVRGADYVAWFHPGDVYASFHLATLAARIPAEHERRDAALPFRVGHMNKFFENLVLTDLVPGLQLQPHAVGLGGYIYEHVTEHCINWEAPSGLVDAAYQKLPWHTILIGRPILPGYVFRWTTARSWEAHLDDHLMDGMLTPETYYLLTENTYLNDELATAPVHVGWTEEYDALIRNNIYGTATETSESCSGGCCTPHWVHK